MVQQLKDGTGPGGNKINTLMEKNVEKGIGTNEGGGWRGVMEGCGRAILEKKQHTQHNQPPPHQPTNPALLKN